MRTTFITLMLCSSGISAVAQVGYRTTAASTAVETPKSNRYDSSYDFEEVPTDVDVTSMIGQQLYFPGGWQLSDRGGCKLTLVEDQQEAPPEEPKGKKWMPVKPIAVAPRVNKEPSVYKPDITMRSYFTCRDSIVNKTFTITNLSIKRDPTSGYYNYIYTMRDEKGISVNYITKRQGSTYDFTGDPMPFYIVGYVQKIKDSLVGKVYYKKDDVGHLMYDYLISRTQSVPARKKYVCTDYVFMDGACNHADPKVILKDEEGKELATLLKTGRGRHGVDKDVFNGYDSNPGALSSFWTEKEYQEILAKEKAEADKAAAAAAVQRKADSIQRKQDAAYRANVTKKYGAAVANKILNGKVDLGMTPDMCKVAWGTPSSISKNTIGGTIVETWHYQWGTYLSFKNGKLSGFSE